MNKKNLLKTIRLAKQTLKDEKFLGYTDIIFSAPKIKKSNKTNAPEPEIPAVPLKETPVPVFKGAKAKKLSEIEAVVKTCRLCRLGDSRIKAVFGEGNPDSKIMFVGEGPGYDEDRQGRPFIGRAGQLLTKIIESIGLKREDVFIANIVKCHPMIDPKNPDLRGNDRPPSKEEMACCMPFLLAQIDIIKPKVIVTLGNSSTSTLLETTETISKIRGKFHTFHKTPLMPTYHPSALLRNPALKIDVWNDMKLLKKELGL